MASTNHTGQRSSPTPFPDSWSPARQGVARYFECLPGPAWLKDDAGRYVYANVAAERAFGLTRTQIYGRTDDELFATDTAIMNQSLDNKVLATGDTVQSVDELELAGKKHHMMSLRFAVEGPSMLIGGLQLDVSERVGVEEDLRRAVARKREFLATVAHELRNPLAPITTALNILQYRGGHSEDTDRLLEVIQRQARLMSHLIEDLMDASRIARGKIQVKLEATDLMAAVRTALEISKPQIEAARHELVLSLPDEALPVMADTRRLTQVFSNLLNNAAKFTPDGGRIRLEARRLDHHSEVVVGDDGVGIDAQMLPRIFDLFAQAGDPHDRRTHGGLGIGLALVKRLVELHHGTVAAYSDGPGHGATFVVRLPLFPAGRAASQDESARTDRVLVVDDNRDAADCLGELMKMFGTELEVVYDGAAAIASCASFEPTLALLDLGMPGMDGYAVAEKMRELRGAALTLVAVTAWSDEETRRRTREAGFDHHLVKPVGFESIRALMQANETRPP